MSDEPKPKSNAVLKNLPEDRQEQIFEWCEKPNDQDALGNVIPRTGGLAFARKQLAEDGLKVSLDSLSEFRRWYGARLRYRLALAASEQQQELMAQFRPGDAKLAREYGEYVLLQVANDSQDVDIFTAVTMAQDSRRRLTLDEASAKTKAEQNQRKLDQKDEDLKIARAKFRRETAELFIEWSSDQRAKDILSSGASKADKIEALGQAMFGDTW
jgi:hypothetical protein